MMNIKKNTLAFLTISLLGACASANIVRWEGKKYTVCGNAFADDETFHQTMKKKCYKFNMLSGGIYSDGSASIIPGNNYMPARIESGSQECRTYECDYSL